jgi:hypothetical protein
MKAKNLILITSHLESKDLQGSSGQRLRVNLKRALELAQKYSLTPVVVLGPAGDELLLSFNELENCDLTFDTNYTGSIFSSVQSGLAAAEGASFVLPLDETALAEDLWVTLDQTRRATPPTETVDVFQVLGCVGGDRVTMYPQLVTVPAVARLQKLPLDVQWLHDPRLHIRVVQSAESKPEIQP